MFQELLKIVDFQIFGHMLIRDAHFFYFIFVNFQYFILGWPTLVLGPSISGSPLPRVLLATEGSTDAAGGGRTGGGAGGEEPETGLDPRPVPGLRRENRKYK